ncbi:MAG TPA: AMP-binding protein, partial [Gammaproteobacteria bacterium]|nr:AMP-binding protein [Gammaproteobacteria bacterium]
MTPRHGTLAALVASFAPRGDAEAVMAFGIDSTVSLSYAALHAQILDVAAGLEAKGIGRGDFVLLCGANSPSWIAAYFATVCTGAAAIPVDDQAGKETLAAVIRHSGARFAFTTRRHIEELGEAASSLDYALLEEGSDLASSPSMEDSRTPGHGPETAGRTEPSERDAAGRAEPPGPDPAGIASLVYTSGTTGTPKAVPLTHANLISNAVALMHAGLIQASDRVLLPLPMHHSYPFTVGLLLVLGIGATLVLPSGISGPEITGALKSGRATAMLGVPSLYAAIWQGIETRVQAGGARRAHLFHRLRSLSRHTAKLTGVRLGRLLFRPLHSGLGAQLRILGCGGAKLDPELAENLETLGWIVLSGYGLTETSPVLTFNAPKERRLDTEGKPIPGVEIAIAPSASSGAHGEILARGPNVFGGYWQNPEATRGVFTADGWFRTGDLGWMDDAGYLHVAGRLKEVIVLADGKNVFPEDVEPAYAASPLLREVALLERGGNLVALVVPDEDELRRRGGLGAVRLLGEEIERRSVQLPRYQRVMDFRAVRTPLPRTRLGKIRRHLLPELYERAAQRSLEEQPAALTEEDERLVNASETTRGVWE